MCVLFLYLVACLFFVLHYTKSCLNCFLVPLFQSVCHDVLFSCFWAFSWLVLKSPLHYTQYILWIYQFAHSLLSYIFWGQCWPSLGSQEIRMHQYWNFQQHHTPQAQKDPFPHKLLWRLCPISFCWMTYFDFESCHEDISLAACLDLVVQRLASHLHDWKRKTRSRFILLRTCYLVWLYNHHDSSPSGHYVWYSFSWYSFSCDEAQWNNVARMMAY